MFFERHGASKPPLTFLPRIPPRIVRGNPTGRERGREREREGESEREKEITQITQILCLDNNIAFLLKQLRNA